MPKVSPLTATLRASRSFRTRTFLSRRSPAQQRRHYSSSPPPDASPVADRPSFYKTFSRPIFKVALMAIFTYQLAYYGWVKLETDEVRAEAAATIADLEGRIEALEQARSAKAKK